MKQYDIILADPPWDFDVWNKDTGSGRSAISHYNVMTLEEMSALKISKLAKPNCALFLWGVWPRIFDIKILLDAWEFSYRTLAWEWIKLTKDGSHPTMGMGYYFRANPEPCLLAVRGRMPVSVHNELNLLFSPRTEHSSKPEEQYNKIERVYPKEQYPDRIELFARKRFPGWEATGLELTGEDIREFLEK